MAQIDCLSIRGIRSFSDESAELLTFSKPLTVITGANGCGKTTIIECLKYVTTGELPPGTTNGEPTGPKAELRQTNSGQL